MYFYVSVVPYSIILLPKPDDGCWERSVFKKKLMCTPQGQPAANEKQLAPRHDCLFVTNHLCEEMASNASSTCSSWRYFFFLILRDVRVAMTNCYRRCRSRKEREHYHNLVRMDYMRSSSVPNWKTNTFLKLLISYCKWRLSFWIPRYFIDTCIWIIQIGLNWCDSCGIWHWIIVSKIVQE